MLSFAQDYEQCRTAFLRETEYKNVEGLRDDLYYACILFGTGTPEYRAVGNAVLEGKNASIFESKMQQKLQNPLSCGKRAVIIRIECNASLRDLHIFYGEIA